MTPLQLFALICIFAVVRVAISIRPRAMANGGAAAAETPESGSTRAVLREYLDAFIVAGLVALFLITFVVRTFFIPSGSMEPTLQVHDVLLVNEFEYRFLPPKHGDIVVFPPPIDSTNDFIKRLMGAPGDTLRIHNGTVYRNGAALSEPYTAQKPAYELEIKNFGIYVDGNRLDPALAHIPPKSAWTSPDRIPDGYYFMMGDNRNNSEDSHIWGFAQLHGTFASGYLKGKPAHFTGHAFLLFWPLNRFRILH
ncbi:MAG: signal peptidase I [Candidatus Eremiobacteraeota bacterium]|nr:signal peptidase I [Candidatus Eremiobacteraeota bacterium]